MTLRRCREAKIVLIGVDELIESEQSKHTMSQVVVGSQLSEKTPNAQIPKKLFVISQVEYFFSFSVSFFFF